MAFIETLKELVENTPGGVAATVMGTDGIAVRQYTREGGRYDIETIGIEYGKVIEEIKHASTLLNLGTVEEITVNTQGTNLLLRMLTPEYYIAFVVDGPSGLGKGRYKLRKAASEARKELLA